MNIKELKEAAEAVIAAKPTVEGWRSVEHFDNVATPEAILSLIERYEQMEEALRRIAKRAKPHDDDTDDDRKRDLFHILAIAEANVSPIAEVANADPR